MYLDYFVEDHKLKTVVHQDSMTLEEDYDDDYSLYVLGLYGQTRITIG